MLDGNVSKKATWDRLPLAMVVASRWKEAEAMAAAVRVRGAEAMAEAVRAKAAVRVREAEATAAVRVQG